MMSPHMYAKCTYNQTTFMFFVTPRLSFDVIVEDVMSHFGLKPGSFSMSFSLPNYPSCMLSNDSHLKLMMCSMMDANVCSCDIVVKANEIVNGLSSSGSCMVEGEASISSSISSKYADILDPNDYLGCFSHEAQRTYLSKEWADYISHVNQKFPGGAYEFRDRLKKHAIEVGFVFRYKRNHADKIAAECSKKADGCRWHVTAKKGKMCNGAFFITELNKDHTCKGVLRTQRNKHLDSKTISTIVSQGIKGNPSIKPKDIISTIKTSYGLETNYRQALYGKGLAFRNLRGGDGDSYSQMSWYCDSVLSTNPDSHCVLETNPITDRFERFFVSFGGCIKGFTSCVPILFVDAAHLKGKYKGIMLCATGKNGNDEFYPFAFATVVAENKQNWLWFFHHLHQILTPQGRIITFFSDRNKGLLDAVATVFLESPHSYCYYHLKQNVIKCYEKQQAAYDVDNIVYYFMATSYSPTEKSYAYNLNKLLSIAGEPIKPLLRQLDLHKWCNAYFKGNRYGEMSNSIAESFNSWTEEFRDLPIFEMYETLRVKLMESMARRKSKADTWTTTLCPDIEKKLKGRMDVGRHWFVRDASPTTFEVEADRSVMVDLENYECSCRHWQIDSFPCSHALAAIQHIDRDPVYLYIEPYYEVESYKNAYAYGITPIPNIEKFYDNAITEKKIVKPPVTRVPSGRPRAVRIKSSVEGYQPRAITCGRCHEVGRHNKSSCNRPIAD